MRILAAYIACIISYSSATAEDHLLPEQSLFTGIYYEKGMSLLASRLGRMSGLDAFANAVVFPSFSREYVIAFERSKQDEYKLVCMQTNMPMGLYQLLDEMRSGRLIYENEEKTKEEVARLERELPKDYWDVEASVVEMKIDKELGRELYYVWGKMLYGTRYPQPRELTPESMADFDVGYDGTTYHFSFFHSTTPLSGWIWDYPAEGRVAKLVALTIAAKEACDSGDRNATASLSDKVRSLADALK